MHLSLLLATDFSCLLCLLALRSPSLKSNDLATRLHKNHRNDCVLSSYAFGHRLRHTSNIPSLFAQNAISTSFFARPVRRLHFAAPRSDGTVDNTGALRYVFGTFPTRFYGRLFQMKGRLLPSRRYNRTMFTRTSRGRCWSVPLQLSFGTVSGLSRSGRGSLPGPQSMFAASCRKRAPLHASKASQVTPSAHPVFTLVYWLRLVH